MNQCTYIIPICTPALNVLERMWFLHYSSTIQDYLNQIQMIRCIGMILSTRFPDLNAIYKFLWKHLKSETISSKNSRERLTTAAENLTIWQQQEGETFQLMQQNCIIRTQVLYYLWCWTNCIYMVKIFLKILSNKVFLSRATLDFGWDYVLKQHEKYLCTTYI